MACRQEEDAHLYPTPFLEELEVVETDIFSPVSRHPLRGSRLLFGILASLLIHLSFLAALAFLHSRLPAAQGPVPVMVHLVRGDELGIPLREAGGALAGAGGAPEESPGGDAAETVPTFAPEATSHHEVSREDTPQAPPEPAPTAIFEPPAVPEPAKEVIREVAKPKPAPKPRSKPSSQPKDLIPSQNPPPVRASEASHGKNESTSEQTGGKAGETVTADEGAGAGAGKHEATGRGDLHTEGTGSDSQGGSRQISGGRGVSAGELHLNQVERPPQVLRRVEPTYPFAARSRNLTGKVMVKVLVSPDGEVTKPFILEANPKGVFEECVLEAVRQWRFKPGYHQGRAVATWVVLPIYFKLAN